MKKRLVSIILAAAVITTTVTGCGKSLLGGSASSAPTETSDVAASYLNRGSNASDTAEEYPYYESDVAYDADAYSYTESAVEECAEAEYDMSTEMYSYDTADLGCAEEAAVYDPQMAMSAKAMEGGAGYLDSIYDYPQDKDVNVNGEEYSDLEEMGYKRTSRNPVSTFAADVDTASYSNLRRLLSYGMTLDELPENSVRIEELINYFNYSYEGPQRREPFGVTTVIGDCPWNRHAKLLSIGLQTEDIDFDKAPASNLVFLIDVSGSMYDEDKLPLLQDAYCMLVDQLDAKDRVSIVTYAGEESVVLEGVKGSEHKKIKKAIAELEAGGSTNGSAGIRTAYDLATENYIEGGNNRVILATDGDLNVGLTSVDELERLISKEKERGIFLSVLGFGSGNIKDNRMETLADKGNGNYSFIDSIKEAKKVLVTELSANMLTVCKDVKLQVEFNPEVVDRYRLIGYTNRVMKNKDFDDDTKDGGEIGAGHSVTAMYELILDDDFEEELEDKITDEKLLDLNIRFERPTADESELLTYTVDARAYTNHPSDDFLFQSAVAEFGLIASGSEYAGKASLEDVLDILDSMELDDEYKEEFYDMVEGVV